MAAASTSVRFLFYAERNTGSRWFESMLRGHFPYIIHPRSPWKHGCVSFPPSHPTGGYPGLGVGGVHQIVLVKNPYSWLLRCVAEVACQGRHITDRHSRSPHTSLFNRPYNSYVSSTQSFGEFLHAPLPAHDATQVGVGVEKQVAEGMGVEKQVAEGVGVIIYFNC